MKNIIYVFLLLFFANTILAQEPSVSKISNEYRPKVEANSDNTIYNTVGLDKIPEFPGGIKEFYAFVGANYKIPSSSGKIQGRVLIEFVIEKDGSITDIKVLRDLGYETGSEAVRVLELSPSWLPGILNGNPVRCKFVLPIALNIK